MSNTSSKLSCCQNPKELKNNVENCSTEQIKKCHGDTEYHPCLSNKNRKFNIHMLYSLFIFTVISAPILFSIYLNNNLVCAPRAITSSAIFGIVPLFFLTFAIFKKKNKFYYTSLFILIIEIIITPIIMIKRLGWEKLINERLLAFFSFEGIAIIQICIILLLLHSIKFSNK